MISRGLAKAGSRAHRDALSGATHAWVGAGSARVDGVPPVPLVLPVRRGFPVRRGRRAGLPSLSPRPER